MPENNTKSSFNELFEFTNTENPSQENNSSIEEKSSKRNLEDVWVNPEHWIKKGYSKKEAEVILCRKRKKYVYEDCIRLFGPIRGEEIWQLKQPFLNMGTRNSPFSQEFWMKKGMTAEEADFKRNSFRPIKPEYWIVQGFDEEAARIKAAQVKDENNKKGAEKSKTRTKEEWQKNCNTSVAYWTERGYSEEEAKQIISKRQATFSLDVCIEKYGAIEGLNIWKNRQHKWQESLNSRDEEKIKKTNASKARFKLENYETLDDAINHINSIKVNKVVKTLEEYKEVIKREMEENPTKFYNTPKEYYDDQSPTQLKILNLDYERFKEIFGNLFKDLGEIYKHAGSYGGYMMNTPDGKLLSSYEIYFYDKFCNLELNKFFKVEINRRYPKSSMRFDFRLTHQEISYTIEICPMIHDKKNEKYLAKMLKKQKLFGCILLSTVKEIDQFFQRIKEDHGL
jgi:hypothetical protein